MKRYVGSYEILGELGRGGFGRVYRAYDPKVGRIVAIKVVDSSDDAGMAKRFRSEAATLGNLHHPNIVTVYEFGEDAGQQYIVMEFLDGTDLAQVIQGSSPLPLVEMLEIMLYVAEGLMYAHEHSIVHRDIKPANIMRLKDGRVKLMDFGIARVLRAKSTRLTQKGYLVGTCNYMAPEQFGENEPDPLCDIWAFGVVCFEFLTGKHPFQSSDTMATMYKIVNQAPPVLSDYLPWCPDDLQTMVQKLLQKPREDRYQSMEDVLLDLRPVVRGLAKHHVKGLIVQAESLISDNNLEEAHSAVRRILELDDSNEVARKLRKELRQKESHRSLQKRIEVLIEGARNDEAEQQYDLALEKIDSALKLDTNNTALRSFRQRVDAKEKNRAKAKRLLEEARREFRSEGFSSAFQKASEALSVEPDNAEIQNLLEQAQRSMEDRDHRIRIKNGLNKAKGLFLMQAYDEAAALLYELSKEDPSDPEVQQRLQEAVRLKQEKDAHDRILLGIDRCRELMKLGQYDQAAGELEILSIDAPDHPSIPPLLNYAREQRDTALREQEIRNLVADASQLLKDGDLDGAFRMAQRATKLDGGHPEVLRLQQAVLDSKRAIALQQRITEILEQLRPFVEAKKYEEALQVVQQSLVDFPADERLLLARKEIGERLRKQREEQFRQVEKNRLEAEDLLAKGNIDQATKLLKGWVSQYPEESRFTELISRAHLLQAEKSNREAVQNYVAKARDLESRQNVNEAIEVLSKGLRDHPNDENLLRESRRLLTRKAADEELAAIESAVQKGEIDKALHAAKAAQKQFPDEGRIAKAHSRVQSLKEVQETSKQVTKFISAGDLDKAAKIVADARARHPGLPQILALAEDVEAQKVIAAGLDRGRNALKARKFSEAAVIVERLLESWPANQAARDLLNEIETESAKQESRAVLERERGEIQTLLQLNQFESALRRLEPLRETFPGDKGLEEMQKRARSLLGEQQRARTCAEARQQAEQLAGVERFDEALQVLAEVLRQYPNEPGLNQSRRAITDAKRLRDERLAIEARVREMDTLFRQGDAEAVLPKAQKFLSEREEPRVRELLEWAKASLTQAKEVRAERPAPPSGKKWVLAGVGVLVLGGVFAASRFWRTGVEVQVSPGKVEFSFQFGAPPPQPQVVRIEDLPEGQKWSVNESEPWYSLNPKEGSGTSAIEVHLNSASMRPGSYSATVNVSSPDGKFAPKPLTIRVQVSEAPPLGDPSPVTNRDTKEKKESAENKTGQTKKGPEVADKPKVVAENKPKPTPVPELQVTPAPTPTPTPEPPKPLEAQVDCHAASYLGLTRGTLRWSGQLAPGATLVIGRRNSTLSGPQGQFKGSALPGCDVSLSLQTGAGVQITEGPAPGNNFGRLAIRNTSSGTVSNVVVDWVVK